MPQELKRHLASDSWSELSIRGVRPTCQHSGQSNVLWEGILANIMERHLVPDSVFSGWQRMCWTFGWMYWCNLPQQSCLTVQSPRIAQRFSEGIRVNFWLCESFRHMKLGWQALSRREDLDFGCPFGDWTRILRPGLCALWQSMPSVFPLLCLLNLSVVPPPCVSIVSSLRLPWLPKFLEIWFEVESRDCLPWNSD